MMIWRQQAGYPDSQSSSLAVASVRGENRANWLTIDAFSVRHSRRPDESSWFPACSRHPTTREKRNWSGNAPDRHPGRPRKVHPEARTSFSLPPCFSCPIPFMSEKALDFYLIQDSLKGIISGMTCPRRVFFQVGRRKHGRSGARGSSQIGRACS